MGYNRRLPPQPREDETLYELRAAGVPLYVRCPVCKRHVDLDPNALTAGDHETMNSLARRFTCTGCGRKGGMSVGPDPRSWVRYLRATGQRTRVPWYGANMMDED